MTEEAFSFGSVTKRFGIRRALEDVTFSVPRGSIVGLVGRNGAGKTTAIRCLVGLLRPSRGAVRLLGQDPLRLPIEVKEKVGYMATEPLPFGQTPARKLIAFCSRLYPHWDAALEEQMIDRFAIDDREPLEQLSLGTQRAVALLLAVCPRPAVLILDEPAANLDPVLRREFLAYVIELVANSGSTVLFSSHILSDVERVADRIVVLDKGRLLMSREVDDLKERVRRVRLTFRNQVPPNLEIPNVLCARSDDRELLLTIDDFSPELVERIGRDAGAHVEVQPVALEELFLDLVSHARSPPNERADS